MTLEQQVASLELCKRLKTLGVRQESVFYWCEDGCGPHFGMGRIEVALSAFTVAELGILLGRNVN